MAKIIKQISNHPILGKTRAIRVKQIAYIDFDIKEARVTWEELFLDEQGEPIIDETVSNRTIVSQISNQNTVTEQGIVIDEANFPKMEGEEDEAYQERLNAIKAKGFPEFEFYVGAILNSQAIGQAIELLDHLNRFNRK